VSWGDRNLLKKKRFCVSTAIVGAVTDIAGLSARRTFLPHRPLHSGAGVGRKAAQTQPGLDTVAQLLSQHQRYSQITRHACHWLPKVRYASQVPREAMQAIPWYAHTSYMTLAGPVNIHAVGFPSKASVCRKFCPKLPRNPR